MPSKMKTLGTQNHYPTSDQPGESGFAVAEPLEPDAHQIHQREEEAAGTSMVVSAIEIVEDPAGTECSAGASGKDDRELLGAVGIAIEEAGGQHEDRVIQQR